MNEKYTALFTWPIASTSRKRVLISVSYAISRPSELPVQLVPQVERYALHWVARHVPERGEGLLREGRVAPPRGLDPQPVGVLDLPDDPRGHADGNAVRRDPP